MNSDRINEIQSFVFDFNNKLKNSFDNMKLKINKERDQLDSSNTKKLKKSSSAINSLSALNKKKLKRKSVNNNKLPKLAQTNINFFKPLPPWVPTHAVGGYFGEFKKLNNEYEMNVWDINRIGIAERSYRKEKDLPQGHDFICRNLIGYDFNKNPNKELNIDEVVCYLSPTGKKIITDNMKANKNLKNKLIDNEENLFKYYHSKPEVKYNSWKFSNHIIKDFSILPGDLVHSYKVDIPLKPNYMTKPFRRPKENGDYFDKNVGYL